MREPLPISRIRLNPDVYLTSGERCPMINGLDSPYYLHRGRANIGVITDAKRATIGTIAPEGEDYWRDELTGRVWNSPIAAAHTYLLALAPEPWIPKAPKTQAPQPEGREWRELRSKLSILLTMPSMDNSLRIILKQTIRQIDAVTRKDEIE